MYGSVLLFLNFFSPPSLKKPLSRGSSTALGTLLGLWGRSWDSLSPALTPRAAVSDGAARMRVGWLVPRGLLCGIQRRFLGSADRSTPSKPYRAVQWAQEVAGDQSGQTPAHQLPAPCES